jgi:P27 family predicted phage terminase small subunit
MSRGPTPKPSAQRRLEGNPAKRPIPDEPKPEQPADSIAPEWVQGEARMIWDELAPELHRLRLLTKLDVAALAGACFWWSIFRRTATVLQYEPLTMPGKKHGEVRRPEFQMAQQAYELALGTFAKFGVTPGERMRLATPTARPAGETTRTDAHDILAARRAARGEQQPAA